MNGTGSFGKTLSESVTVTVVDFHRVFVTKQGVCLLVEQLNALIAGTNAFGYVAAGYRAQCASILMASRCDAETVATGAHLGISSSIAAIAFIAR
jgi:hypothetical protein